MRENTNTQQPGESKNQTNPSDTVSSTAAGPSPASAKQTTEEVLPILPKGFVENTAEVYAEVASYDTLPPEKLREYWRVYTTTNRRLCDPTAQRLESFWWHVWGSKLRYSSGDTLAKLYESISTGPTFVPLRGPANRYEGPSIPARAQIQAPKDAEAREDSHQPRHDRDRTHGGGTESRNHNAAANNAEETQHSIGATVDDEAEPQAPVKVVSSSASRPPPAQSILRKPRSASPGTRPTPRFTLPTDIPTQDGPDNHARTDTEDTVGSSSFVSGSGSASSGLAAVPSLSSAGSSRSGPRKQGEHKQTKARHAKKKFMASPSKRKALVMKRSGSQVLSSVLDASGLQDTRRLQPSKTSLDDHPTPGGIPGRMASFPTKPNPPGSSTPPEEELAILRSLQQQQQTHKQADSSPLMCDTTTTDKQTAQQRDPPRSAAARLPGLQGTDSSVTDVAPMAPRETQSQHQQPEPVPTSMARRTAFRAGSSALDGSAGSREIPGRPSCRLIRQMTLPQEIGQTDAPTSAARSFPNPSASLEAATSFRPSTPRSGPYAAPMLLRSTSQDGSAFLSRRGGATAPSPTLSPRTMGATALAAPSMVAARGVFAHTDGPDPFQVYATTGLNDHLDDDDDDDGDQLEPSFHLERSNFSYTDPNPLHRPTFTPTRPSPTPRIPFARTRSQLNVILDREKERLGQGTFDSWQESRTGRDQ